ADTRADFVGGFGDVKTRDLRVSAARRQQRAEQAHRGRLARAVRAEQPVDLTGLDVEGEPVDGSQRAEIAHEPDGADHRPAGYMLGLLRLFQDAHAVTRSRARRPRRSRPSRCRTPPGSGSWGTPAGETDSPTPRLDRPGRPRAPTSTQRCPCTGTP